MESKILQAIGAVTLVIVILSTVWGPVSGIIQLNSTDGVDILKVLTISPSSGSIVNVTGDLNITGALDVATINTGTWQGTAISSSYIGSHSHIDGDIPNDITIDNATNADTVDGSHASAFATSGHVHSGGPNTIVYNTNAPSSWTDLDLSSVVGSNSALVVMRITNNHGSQDEAYAFRTNGDSTTQRDGAGAQNPINPGYSATLIAVTDSAGIVEWDTTFGYNTTVTVLWYSTV
jgi:hypothetical protein